MRARVTLLVPGLLVIVVGPARARSPVQRIGVNDPGAVARNSAHLPDGTTRSLPIESAGLVHRAEMRMIATALDEPPRAGPL